MTPLPQLPITGFNTKGNPTFSRFSFAASAENEKYVLGVGTLFFFKHRDMISLFPQLLATTNLLITGTSKNSRQAVK